LRIVFVVSGKTKIKLLFWCLLAFILLVFFWHQITVRARTVIRPGLPLSQKVISIDPGHGGYDPGGEANEF
jgi:N-acetylmuramoyl-L-alanine amidase